MPNLKTVYFKLRVPASYLPDVVLQFLNSHWRLNADSSDGWTFWLDASYHKYCRHNGWGRHGNARKMTRKL